MENIGDKVTRQILIAKSEKAAELIKAKNDPYYREALKLRDALLGNWNKLQKEAINEAIRKIVKGSGKLTKREFNKILKRLGKVLGVNMAAGVDTAVAEIMEKTYSIGQADVTQAAISFNLVDEKALTWLHENHLYWIGKHYDNALNDKIKGIADEIIKEGLGREEAGKLFAKKLGDEFSRSKYYWEAFSNHAVTRAREFGKTEGYVKSGTIVIEIRAVLDHRTSPICREMHGRKIEVSKLVKLRDKIINAKDPEAVKEIDKWRTVDDIKGLPDEKLPLSMAMPPYHFGCRTTTVKYITQTPI